MVEVETRDILCAVHIDNVARKCEECKEKDVTRKDALAAALRVKSDCPGIFRHRRPNHSFQNQ